MPKPKEKPEAKPEAEAKAEAAPEPTPEADPIEKLLTHELPPVSETGAGFIADEPEATESDEAGQPETVTTGAEDYRGTPDEKGKPYDPALHAFPPEKTATGRWRKKPRKQTEKDTLEGESNVAYRREAEKIARLYAQLHMIPFGEDGAPKSNEDLLPLVDAWERYMLEHGKKEIPSSFELLLSSGLYTYEVSSRKPNHAKLKKLWRRFMSWIRPGSKAPADERKEEN